MYSSYYLCFVSAKGILMVLSVRLGIGEVLLLGVCGGLMCCSCLFHC